MKTALIVLDVQPVFINIMHKSEVFLKRCLFAIEAARLLGIPVILTEQVPNKLGACNSQILKVAGAEAPCFSKETFSAFGAPGFYEHLKKMEIDHLLIAGLDAAICVYQTVLEALQGGYGVTVLSDSIGSKSSDDKLTIERAFDKMNCHQLPSETVFYSILKSSNHPDFRTFTKLVVQYS